MNIIAYGPPNIHFSFTHRGLGGEFEGRVGEFFVRVPPALPSRFSAPNAVQGEHKVRPYGVGGDFGVGESEMPPKVRHFL
jgi:hypothetical protein